MGNSAERVSRFSFAICCLAPNQMNLVVWALRRSRFEDIKLARAPLPGAWYEWHPLPQWKGNASLPGRTIYTRLEMVQSYVVRRCLSLRRRKNLDRVK